MKSSFALALLTALATAQQNGASAPEVIELIDGFLIGALETEHVDGLETCVKDFNPLVNDMIAAVQDFEDGSFTKIADGIYQLGQFISQVGIVLGDCDSVSDDDVAKLTAMGEAFLHPIQLVIDAENNVIVNGVQIFKDVRAAGKDMADAKFEKAGEQYGTVAALVLWGGEEMQASTMFLQ